uniref:HMG box domain-containing protein n=1 Tax=Lepeophtheirus salmonis TaxID=72036 RepID=A0A0K2VB22_LEPSM
MEMNNMREDEDKSSSQLIGRRPMNAFLLFSKRHRDTVKEKYPTLENRSITKILGDWWTSLSSEDKSAYTDLALEYKLHLSNHHHNQNEEKLGDCDKDDLSLVECSENQVVASAPKPFKKRFLAAATTTTTNTEGKSPEEVENDDAACKALLQLAGVRDSPTPPSSQQSVDKDSNGSKEPEEGFRTLKKAVWGRVAKTLLKQEEERITGDENGDSPINLSTQCTIRGQTIIEHIIENILDKSPSLGDETGQHRSSSLNNNNPFNNLDSSSEQIKERIYQSLKEDMGCDRPDMSALRKSLPNPLAKKPIKSSDDEEKRPSRSCKGRRYQEYKEEGRFGRKRRHRSGSNSSPSEDNIQNPPPMPPSSTSPNNTHTPCKPFNVSAKLNALPVLSLEEYQRKMSKIKSGINSRRKSGDEELSRRQSRSRNESEQLIA